jgi:hypothetical protein
VGDENKQILSPRSGRHKAFACISKISVMALAAKSQKPQAGFVAANLQEKHGVQPPSTVVFRTGKNRAICISANKYAACHDVTVLKKDQIRGAQCLEVL